MLLINLIIKFPKIEFNIAKPNNTVIIYNEILLTLFAPNLRTQNRSITMIKRPGNNSIKRYPPNIAPLKPDDTINIKPKIPTMINKEPTTKKNVIFFKNFIICVISRHFKIR